MLNTLCAFCCRHGRIAFLTLFTGTFTFEQRFAFVGPTSDVGGLICYFFISMCNEIKAVSTLALG